MKEQQPPLPEYVFRGTTYNFRGGGANTIKPYRCYSSSNPIKAAYFAHVCRGNFIARAVVYIAKTKKLVEAGIIYMINPDPLARAEEEIIWEIKPKDFYKHCEGYITLKELKDALRVIGKPLNYAPTYSNLSVACFETQEMSVNEIEKLIDIIYPIIKNA